MQTVLTRSVMQMISSTEAEVYTSWAKLKTKSSRMTTCMKTSNTQNLSSQLKQKRKLKKDTDSEDEGGATRIRFSSETVGALHVTFIEVHKYM